MTSINKLDIIDRRINVNLSDTQDLVTAAIKDLESVNHQLSRGNADHTAGDLGNIVRQLTIAVKKATEHQAWCEARDIYTSIN